MNTELMFSSKTDDWATPQAFFDELNAMYGFTLDVAADDRNHKVEHYFSIAEDGLAQDWGTNICWCNPPYGRGVIDRWMTKAYEAAQAGATVVCLVPARTDTQWFRIAFKGEVEFVCGRLKFGDATSGAPFPSAVVVFRPPGMASDRHRWLCMSHPGQGCESVNDSRVWPQDDMDIAA